MKPLPLQTIPRVEGHDACGLEEAVGYVHILPEALLMDKALGTAVDAIEKGLESPPIKQVSRPPGVERLLTRRREPSADEHTLLLG